MNSRDTLLVSLQNSACHLHPCTWKSIPKRGGARRDTRGAARGRHSGRTPISVFVHSYVGFLYLTIPISFVINSRGNDRSPIRAETWLSPWIVFPILHTLLAIPSRYAHWIANQPAEITNLSHLEKQFFPIARLNEIKECLLSSSSSSSSSSFSSVKKKRWIWVEQFFNLIFFFEFTKDE